MSVAGCPKNDDVTPQIRVSPGAAARARLMDSYRGGGKSVDVHPSRVHPMVAGEELGGPNAVGKPGDLLLENDEVAFVIDRLGSSAGFAESGGNLVDAADARSRKDELGQLFTYFGTFPRQGVYEKCTSGTTPEGAAWVTAEGAELYDPSLHVVTRYMLAPGDRALRIETNVTNRGDHESEKLSLGDAIQWGGAEKLAPGKSLGFKGASSGPFVGGIGRTTSYAVTGADGTIDGFSGGSWTDTVQKKDITLQPGEEVHYARIFLVGERGDSASLAFRSG